MTTNNYTFEIIKDLYKENTEHIGTYIEVLLECIEERNKKIKQLTENKQELSDLIDRYNRIFETQEELIDVQRKRIKYLEDLLEEYKKISEKLGYKVFKATGKKIYKF